MSEWGMDEMEVPLASWQADCPAMKLLKVSIRT